MYKSLDVRTKNKTIIQELTSIDGFDMSSDSKTHDHDLVLLKSVIYSKVQTTEDVKKLRHQIDKCGQKILCEWTDLNGYDIMHHAIISNNIEAVQILFSLGFFKPPHEPKQHSYMHVAANTGNRAIMSMLLQERPRDFSNRKSTFKWTKPPTEIPVARNGTSSVTPLDVASDSGHVGCVMTILDFYAARNKIETDAGNYLCLACSSNSPSALRLLLKQSQKEENVKMAVGTALKTANAECLNVLLNCNPNLTALFSGMNLYHVLYSYSSSLRSEWYEKLLQVTSVLLKHNQNPLCAIPFRTYPLYSLLCRLPPSDFGRLSHYLTACMVLLMNAGVNPNFNEVEFEKQNNASDIKTAFGRSAYSSAFHCLYDSVGPDLKPSEDDATGIRRYVSKCTETLLRHNTDPSIIGPIGESGLQGNALHAFLKIVILRGLDERSIRTFRLLIQNGADPECCASDKYPLNIFCDEIMYGASHFSNIHKSNEPMVSELVKEIVVTLLDNMSVKCVYKASQVEFDGKPTNDIQKKLFRMAREEIQKEVMYVRTLKALSRLQVLKCCGRRSTEVVKLAIPVSLKSFINRC